MSKLPLRDFEHNYNFYKTNLEHHKMLLKSINEKLRLLNRPVVTESLASDDQQVDHQYQVARLTIDRDECEAKISINEYHAEVFYEHVEQHKPIFKKELEECEANWDKIFEKASSMASKYPLSNLGQILEMYPKGLEEVPDEYKPEVRNETYKALKSQINQIELALERQRDQKKSGKHQQHRQQQHPQRA